MAVVSSDVPRLLVDGLKTAFFEQVNSIKPTYQRICTVSDTTMETQSYGWLGAPPAIREFIDERVAKGLAEFGFEIKDKTWEATIAVDRRSIENDQYGAIMMRVKQLAEAMVNGVDKLAWTILRESNTKTYGYSWDNYDEKGNFISAREIFFADTDHVYPGSAKYTTQQANKGTEALSTATYFTARHAMMAFKDDTGDLMGIVPDTLVVAPKLEETALQITTPVTVVAAAAVNYQNVVPRTSVDPIVCPYWATDDATNTQNWALLKTNGVVKPLILQVFKPAANGQLFEFTALEGNSENGFLHDKYYYGIRGRWNIGYGDWRNMYLNIVS